MTHRMRQLVQRPLVVVGAALLAAFGFATLVMLCTQGQQRFFLLYYFAPIGIPFVGFCLDRLAFSADLTPAGRLADAVVVGLSLLRAGLLPVPYVSGHVLFLTYAVLTARLRVVRWMAIAVMIQVLYLKLVAWRSAATAVETLVGMTLGCAAGWLFWRRGQRADGDILHRAVCQHRSYSER